MTAPTRRGFAALAAAACSAAAMPAAAVFVADNAGQMHAALEAYRAIRAELAQAEASGALLPPGITPQSKVQEAAVERLSRAADAAMKRIEGIAPTTLAALAIKAQALLAMKGGSYDSEAWLYPEDAADFAGTLAGDVIALARGAA